MSVFFYSMIGRQGKTTHAVGYASYSNALLVTNDIDTGTPEIYQSALPQGTIEVLKPGQTLSSVTDRYPSERIVVDF